MVIPATFADERIRDLHEPSDVVVFTKVHKVMAGLVGLLEELDLIDNADLVER